MCVCIVCTEVHSVCAVCILLVECLLCLVQVIVNSSFRGLACLILTVLKLYNAIANLNISEAVSSLLKIGWAFVLKDLHQAYDVIDVRGFYISRKD